MKEFHFGLKMYTSHVRLLLRLDLNMELPQGQTGSVGTSVASAEQVHTHYIIVVTNTFAKLR